MGTFLAEQDDLAVPTYGIRINDGSRKTYVTALAGEDDSMEMIALAPATYAVLNLEGLQPQLFGRVFTMLRTILK